MGTPIFLCKKICSTPGKSSEFKNLVGLLTSSLSVTTVSIAFYVFVSSKCLHLITKLIAVRVVNGLFPRRSRTGLFPHEDR